MTFDTIESSAYEASKVETYLFEVPNSAMYWAHTTSAEPITIDGKTYTPCVISRGEIDQSTGEFEIELPYDHPVVVLHVPYLPPRPMIVTIKAYHRQESGDIRRVQIGAIYGFEQRGEYAVMRCADPNNPLAKLIPRAAFGPNCRHTTYSVACGLNKDDFKTVVDDISAVVDYVITSPKIGLAGTGWFKFGFALNPDNGEVRFITEHIGSTVTLVYPFTGITVATDLHFFAGDDFTAETCRVKFDNKIQYLGFDFHPKYNIFRDGYRAGGYTNTVGTGTGSGRLRST